MCKTSALKNKCKLAVFLVFAVAAYGNAHSQNNGIVPMPSFDTVSRYFSVSVNGNVVPTIKYKDVYYVSFQQGVASRINVSCSEDIKKYTISPLAKKILGRRVNKKSIQFNLVDPSYVVVKINNKQRLFIFSEQPDKDASGQKVSIAKYKVDNKGEITSTALIQQALNETALRYETLYFPVGVYKTGTLEIPSNSKIVFAAGAMLKASDNLDDFRPSGGQRAKGFLNFLNAENVSISGYGVIDGSGRVLRDKYGDSARMRLLFFNNAKNISIQHIIQRDPGSWNTQIQNSQSIDFNRVKLLNDADLANTDGFDPDASSNISIENCFAYCGDDNVAIKITQQNGLRNFTSDITVKNCIFLTRKSSLKVGTESRGSAIKNILFENNDVIMSDRGMALYCSDGAFYENIRYVNNRFEENYADSKQMGFHFSINKRNEGSKEGFMKNILIENCSFNCSFPKPSEVTGLSEDHSIELMIRNLKIAGRRVLSLDDAGMSSKFAEIKIE